MLTIAVEGISDEAIIRRLCILTGVNVGSVHGKRGKPKLDANITGYNAAAQYGPWLVVRDLNGDAPCAPALRSQLLPALSEGMYLRIAVRSVESWLLADRNGVADFLGISRSLVPRSPETLEKPKRTFVNLARRSRRRLIREDIVPMVGLSSEVGAGYTSRIIEFATHYWNPQDAALYADSLRRCIQDLEQIASAHQS